MIFYLRYINLQALLLGWQTISTPSRPRLFPILLRSRAVPDVQSQLVITVALTNRILFLLVIVGVYAVKVIWCQARVAFELFLIVSH